MTLSAKQVATLAPVLTAVLPALNLATPKGRYALVRWSLACETPAATYGKKYGALIESVAVKDSVRPHPVIPGQIVFDIAPDQKDFYAAEAKVLDDEVVDLSGVRPVTYAELGTAPINGEQEKVLVQCGVLTGVLEGEPA